MKSWKKLLLIISISFIAVISKAQSQGLEIGVDVGTNFSFTKIKYQGAVPFSRPAISAATYFLTGISIGKSFSKKIRVQSGLSYYQNASVVRDLEYTDFAGNSLGKGNNYNYLTYFAVPIQFQFINTAEKSAFGVSVGTSFNFLTNGSVRLVLQNPPNGFPRVNKEDASDFYKKFNMSFIAGPTYRYRLNDKFTLTGDLLLNLGLFDISDNDVTNQKINSFNLNFGLKYGLGR